MKVKKIKRSFFKFTKVKLFLIVVFFALIVYLAGIPVRIVPEVTLSVENLPSVIILILLELIISYIIACIVVFLFHKHRGR
jgi:hypothetical protein